MPRVLREMIQHDAAGGMLLVAAALFAIILANTPLSGLYQGLLGLPVSIEVGSLAIDKPLLLWINDGLMALFFFLIGLEVKRELIDGHLSSKEQIMLPAIAAMAGVATPALIYVFFNSGDPVAIQGWAIPAATDIAFALGVFSLFSKRLPISLKLFLLSVAIFDDIAAILIIALFYSQQLSVTSLVFALAGVAALIVVNRFKVRYSAVYILIGVMVWVAVLKSGVHATLAGFVVALCIPLNVNNEHGESMLKALEHSLHPWIAFFILPLFAFANAGVSLLGLGMEDFLNSITLGIALALFLGNQIGIFGSCWVVIKLGLANLPKGANWQQLYGVAALCGIGFTMSLFIGSLAFEGLDPAYLDSVKIGVLLGSILSAGMGAYVITRGSIIQSKEEVNNEKV